MAISTLFFIFLAVFIVAVIAALFNFFSMSKNMFNSVKSMDMEGGFGSMQKGMGLHVLFGGLASLAGLGSLITGIIWIVQAFKA